MADRIFDTHCHSLDYWGQEARAFLEKRGFGRSIPPGIRPAVVVIDLSKAFTNPESPAPRVVERAAIEEMRQTSTSMMPRGLLDKFTRDEIFELFAYLEAGGDPMHSVFHKDEDQ